MNAMLAFLQTEEYLWALRGGILAVVLDNDSVYENGSKAEPSGLHLGRVRGEGLRMGAALGG